MKCPEISSVFSCFRKCWAQAPLLGKIHKVPNPLNNHLWSTLRLTAFCVLVCQTGPVTETCITGTHAKVFDSTLRGKNHIVSIYKLSGTIHFAWLIKIKSTMPKMLSCSAFAFALWSWHKVPVWKHCLSFCVIGWNLAIISCCIIISNSSFFVFWQVPNLNFK